jgi:hypothetical protein
MPCSDSLFWDRDLQEERKRRLDLVTRLLCDQCKAMEKNKVLHLQAKELQDWWLQHRKEDMEKGFFPHT